MPPSGSLIADQLKFAFIEHLHRLSSWALQRHEGEFAAPGQDVAPVVPLANERQKERRIKQIRLPALFDSYSNEKILNDGDTRATRKTIASFKSTVERFVELVGDLHINDIDRDAVGRFRASLARMPAKGEGTRGLSAPALIAKADAEDLTRLSEPTIRNQLRALSAVLSHAVRLDWLSENPVIAGGAGRAAAKAATRKTATARKRKEYTRSELQAIFSSPAFASKKWKPPRANFGEAWYWLPVLLFYTGARREELAQLKAADVRRSEDGIWHINILAVADEEDGDRGVKTESSRRLIPLHPDVMERGFLVYVNSLDNSGQLFPELKANPAGYYGANFGKHWTNYLRSTVRLESPVSPMHGFRHTFKTLCRDVGITEEVHDALTGHAGSSGVGREYGSMSLRRMSEELRRFPRIIDL
jgi:integrase